MKSKAARGARLSIVACLAMAAALMAHHAGAASIELAPGTVNMFRDSRGANNVGLVPGERFQFQADVVGGSAETTVGAVYPPDGFTDPQAPCGPVAVNPNFCAGSTPFEASRIAKPWLLQFERPGAAPLAVTGPSLAGTESAIPFPVSVKISGAGITPTISWEIPGGFVADGASVAVLDRSVVRPNGIADVIHLDFLPASANSYTLPVVLSSGQQLAIGGDYALQIALADARAAPPFGTLRRSLSYFNFSPRQQGGLPDAFLPTVVNGVYNFRIAEVGPTSITFIDPLVAIGYDYAVGAGDPNFASVLLPDVGDGQFLLEYLLNGQRVQQTLAAGVELFFPQGGVGTFSVRGIEASAGLDPNNVTAFLTGLRFSSAGSFTGTMTPITVMVSVPEPGSTALLLAALLGLLVGRRACPQRRQMT